MSQPKNPKKYLVDIQMAIRHVFDHHLDGIESYDDFKGEITRIRALEREFLILGEASRKLRSLGVVLKHSDWLINFRNSVAHQYDEISPRRVYEHAMQDLKDLDEEVIQLLAAKS